MVPNPPMGRRSAALSAPCTLARLGVSTWDEVEDVCWLLGYNDYHRNGEPDDAFEVFNKQFSAGVLLPTADDYDALFADADDRFRDLLLDTGRQFLEQARANPGHEEFVTFGDGGHQVMCVDILVEHGGRSEEGWVGITLPENEALPDEEVYAVVAELIPAHAEPIWERKFKDRDRRPGEIVYRWDSYAADGDDGESKG